METAFRALLLDDSAVTAIVSDRIQPIRLDEGTALPALVYQLISCVPDHSHDGREHSRARVQVASIASTYTAAVALADAVEAAIDGWRGSQDGVEMTITLENRLAQAVRANDAAGNTWTVLQDFFVWY